MMDPYISYTLNNPNIHCVIQEKDNIISRQSKEISDLHKANQLLAKDNDKLRTDLDLQKKLCEALEKFKYTLERHVAVLKDYDNQRWSIPDVESEVRIWEHEYLMIRKMLEKKEREEQALIMSTNAVQSAINANSDPINSSADQTSKQRRSAPKVRPIEVGADGTALKRYVCDFPNCSYRSNWAHDLKGHKRKHTGEKPYTCGWLNCNKSFRDLRDLKRHQRAHTGDKRYSCDWPGCEYRSTDVANLAKHKRTHTGERPYKCDWAGCEASFADGSHLRRHQKKHENQMTKLTKAPTTGPKRRLSAPKTTSLMKTRQQPGRRAKGPRLPIECKLDVSQDVMTDGKSDTSANDLNKYALKSCPTVENNIDSNVSQINKEKSNELIETANNSSDNTSKTIIERVVENDVNSRLIQEQNNSAIDSITNNEPKELINNNSNVMNRMDMNSVSLDESNRENISSGVSDQQMNLMSEEDRNCEFVLPTLMSNTEQDLNSSPLPETTNKEPLPRYSDMQTL